MSKTSYPVIEGGQMNSPHASCPWKKHQAAKFLRNAPYLGSLEKKRAAGTHTGYPLQLPSTHSAIPDFAASAEERLPEGVVKKILSFPSDSCLTGHEENNS